MAKILLCCLSVIYLLTDAVEILGGNDVSYEIATPKSEVRESESLDCNADNVFVCDVMKKECIASSFKCDGAPDCQNGRDESVEVCGCLPHEFQCNSTHCIDLLQRCDLTEDCEGGLDEEGCETFQCPVTHYKCKNHMCVPRDVVCDFKDDCGDNSDESFCKRPDCGYDGFRCDNQQCTKTSRLCDGVKNCLDGSDEDPRHCEDHFRCPEGFHVANKTLCDRHPDCKFSHKDEANCGDCAPPSLQCDNGQCVPEAAQCDNVCDCMHCEDEFNCTTHYCDPSTHFFCYRTNRCIRHQFVCDGVDHCMNSFSGSDEAFCDTSRDCSGVDPKSIFRCKDNRCVPTRALCTRYKECLGGEDEENCDFPACLQDEFTCSNHRCVPMATRCDAHNDCMDWSDEKNCANIPCPEGHVRCRSGQCIPNHKWCNHWPNCPDSSDEENCRYRKCAKDEFTCSNGECIPESLLCYGGRKEEGRGCEDKSHLMYCEDHTCKAGQFKCTKSYCIDKEQVCNGLIDCLQNSADERVCEHPCPAGERVCTCFDLSMNCEHRGLTVIPLPSKEEPHTTFHFSGNFFNESLNSTTFSQSGPHMDKVTHIDLSNNSLTRIPDKLFEYMWRLKYLNLGNNSLTHLSSRSLKGLKSLTQLYLSGNKIAHIDNGTFLDLGQLTTLDLSYQNLTDIGANMFLGMNSLHLLNLSGNRIESIHDAAFNGLHNLLTLDLSNNKINSIGKRVFYGLPQLSFLITDEYRFCCLAASVEKCLPEPDEFSSCEDLMSNHILRIFIWVLGLIASVGNLVVIVWRARDVRGRKVHSFLITNLAVGDLLMGVYLVIIAVVDSHYRGVYMMHDMSWRQSSLCHFAGFISTFSSELSVLTLTVITLDRLVCILFPLRLTRLGVRDATVAMLIVWLVVFLISVVPLVGIPYFQNFYGRSGVCLALHVTPARPPGWEFSVAVFLVFNFISFLVIAGSYVWMFLVARETRSAVRSPETKSDAAMARRMTLIVMTDFVCWVPIILLGFASLGGANASNYVYAWIAVFILPLNSAVNPVLYTLSTAPFLGNVRKRAYRFRKSFMTSATQDTKHSYVDDRTVNSYTERRPIIKPTDAIKMKTLRASINGQSSQYSNDL